MSSYLLWSSLTSSSLIMPVIADSTLNKFILTFSKTKLVYVILVVLITELLLHFL